MTVDCGTLCETCGARSVRPRMRSGRTFAHRNLAALPVPADFPVPTCGRCGAEFFDAETRARLSPILESEYRQTLRRLIQGTLEKLSNHTSQRRLEGLLGLSQGYLSRLRSGSGIPSPELVGHLALLANDPDVRLRELERFWRAPLHGPPGSDPESEFDLGDPSPPSGLGNTALATPLAPTSPAGPALLAAEDPTAIF